MSGASSAQADRDFAVSVRALAALALIGVVGVLLLAAMWITGVVVGSPAGWPRLPELGQALYVLVGGGDAALFGPVTTPAAGPVAVVTAHPGLFWATAGVLIAATGVAVASAAWGWWRRWGPTPAGHASRTVLRAELSEPAARRRARVTRPGLSRAERARAPISELGAPLHRGPIGQLWLPFENHSGALAPTQSGKTRADLIPKILAAPGPLWASSSSPDAFLVTALARTRRPGAGPVVLFDASNTLSWPAPGRWSPIEGCADVQVAARRAHTLVEAAARARTEAGRQLTSSNEQTWLDRAKIVVRAYLIAADLDGHGLDALLKWANHRKDPEPVRTLERFHYSQISAMLDAEITMNDKTADGVWLGVRKMVESWVFNPALRWMCDPPRNRGVNMRSLIGQHGTVYVIGGSTRTLDAVPLFSALAEEYARTAADLGVVSQPGERLDPPATMVCDELTNATPIPLLPQLLSEITKHGLIVHWAAQTIAQLEGQFGEGGTRALLSNTTAWTIWGGITDNPTLQMLSTLFGEREQLRAQRQHEGLLSPARTSWSSQDVPVLRPGDIRQIRRGEVLIAYRHLGPIRARTTDLSRRRDHRQLTADADTIRDGNAPITPSGYNTSQERHQ